MSLLATFTSVVEQAPAQAPLQPYQSPAPWGYVLTGWGIVVGGFALYIGALLRRGRRLARLLPAEERRWMS